MAPLLLDYTVNQRVAGRVGNHSPYAAPHNAYRCRGEDRWCAIAVFTNEEWQSFCRVIGNPSWTRDARFATLEGRQENEMGQIKGMLVSGKEEGAFFTGLDWVQQQCMEKLGFRPYAGTLNLKVTEEVASLIQAQAREEGVSLLPPTSDFCAAACLRVRIGDIQGALVLPMVGSYYKDILEVMAPIRVKDQLSLSDGDEVVLDIR